jgi:hypothetical protein
MFTILSLQSFITILCSSLVRNLHNLPLNKSPGRGPWGPKARRWYQRLLSGVNHHTANRRRLRVMTLTTSLEARAAGLDVNDSFQVLRKRLLRRYPVTGFEYWKLRTSEGNGVLHIIYSGAYIHQGWLSRTWQEIHLSHRVWLQELRGKGKRMTNYLIGHYLPAHDDWKLYTRMSWSWGWVFRGFVGAWKWTFRTSKTYLQALVDWNRLMRRDNPLLYYKMVRGLLFKQTILKKRW